MNDAAVNVAIAEKVFGMVHEAGGWSTGSLPDWAPWLLEDSFAPALELPNFVDDPDLFFALLAWCKERGWEVTCNFTQDAFFQDEVIIYSGETSDPAVVHNSGPMMRCLCLAVLLRQEMEEASANGS